MDMPWGHTKMSLAAVAETHAAVEEQKEAATGGAIGGGRCCRRRPGAVEPAFGSVYGSIKTFYEPRSGGAARRRRRRVSPP